ncbi:DUF1287 domain-containing protein [Polaribacter sp. IC066]|nr:DUF1287 domain-containing protein [Polaribacter sp. IC063]TXD57579.1 DUF1287 domain-containing protein [Polaribacter sp. IC066]
MPNLTTFFSRIGTAKPITKNTKEYVAEDIFYWSLGGAITQIRIVLHKKSKDKQRLLVVDIIGASQVIKDCLCSFKIIGHCNIRIVFSSLVSIKKTEDRFAKRHHLPAGRETRV